MRPFSNPIFVALDTTSEQRAAELTASLRPFIGGVKIGLEFVTANGPPGIRAIVKLGLPVFVDLKFHDIPNTVAAAVKAIAPLGAALINVHASGGEAMMRAAASAVAEEESRPQILAVTVLTSLTDADLSAIGVPASPLEQVLRLANLARASGLDGVVCSPHEIAAIRDACGPDFLIVTPGVRPAGADQGDQRRVMTPAQAMRAGADILVIGRPITGADDPVDAARKIAVELAGGLTPIAR